MNLTSGGNESAYSPEHFYFKCEVFFVPTKFDLKTVLRIHFFIGLERGLDMIVTYVIRVGVLME